FGLEAEGLPDDRRWLDHGRWGLRRPLGAAEPASSTGDAYTFLAAEGEGLHQIPVGPVHAGIIEPGHFRFTANGETDVRLEERLANHFGDIGAICNGAGFSLMHAHCGMLRERVLRAADLAFGHRLMRDVIVPGGVTCDLRSDGATAIRELILEVGRRFPALIELYDNTASLQDRTVATGTLSSVLAHQYAAGGFVGRASGRSFDA